MDIGEDRVHIDIDNDSDNEQSDTLRTEHQTDFLSDSDSNNSFSVDTT